MKDSSIGYESVAGCLQPFQLYLSGYPEIRIFVFTQAGLHPARVYDVLKTKPSSPKDGHKSMNMKLQYGLCYARVPTESKAFGGKDYD